MWFKRDRKMSRRRSPRAVVAIALVLNQLLLATGLPLPAMAGVSIKDRSKPFPCMDRPCGCLNADQCWHSCCCFSMCEKLAWAEAHGIEPPAFVREAAAQEVAEAAASRHGPTVKCCATGRCNEDGACCACSRHPAPGELNAAKRASSLAGDQQPTAVERAPAEARTRIERSRWIVWIVALGCQGNNVRDALLASPGLPASLHFCISIQARSLDQPFQGVTNTPVAALFAPPVPPPRFFSESV